MNSIGYQTEEETLSGDCLLTTEAQPRYSLCIIGLEHGKMMFRAEAGVIPKNDVTDLHAQSFQNVSAPEPEDAKWIAQCQQILLQPLRCRA